MTELQQKHPLHGVGLETLLNELVDYYGWEVLAEQIPIKCFSTYPSIASSVKFLRKTTWARERVEAFYLYRFKRVPLPSEEQHQLPPREREISEDQLGRSPSNIKLGDPEFFDDPNTGPVFSKRQPEADKRIAQPKVNDKKEIQDKDTGSDTSDKVDPWGKWRQ